MAFRKLSFPQVFQALVAIASYMCVASYGVQQSVNVLAGSFGQDWLLGRSGFWFINSVHLNLNQSFKFWEIPWLHYFNPYIHTEAHTHTHTHTLSLSLSRDETFSVSNIWCPRTNLASFALPTLPCSHVVATTSYYSLWVMLLTHHYITHSATRHSSVPIFLLSVSVPLPHIGILRYSVMYTLYTLPCSPKCKHIRVEYDMFALGQSRVSSVESLQQFGNLFTSLY